MSQAEDGQTVAAFEWQQQRATGDDAPNPVSIISTAELFRRPSRPPNHAAENRALVALAQEMAISPDGILQKLAETALVLCRAHSAGLSLLEDDDQRSNFHWRAIAGQWTPHVNGGTPRNFGPCGTVMDRRRRRCRRRPQTIISRDGVHLLDGGLPSLMDSIRRCRTGG